MNKWLVLFFIFMIPVVHKADLREELGLTVYEIIEEDKNAISRIEALPVMRPENAQQEEALRAGRIQAAKMHIKEMKELLAVIDDQRVGNIDVFLACLTHRQSMLSQYAENIIGQFYALSRGARGLTVYFPAYSEPFKTLFEREGMVRQDTEQVKASLSDRFKLMDMLVALSWKALSPSEQQSDQAHDLIKTAPSLWRFFFGRSSFPEEVNLDDLNGYSYCAHIWKNTYGRTFKKIGETPKSLTRGQKEKALSYFSDILMHLESEYVENVNSERGFVAGWLDECGSQKTWTVSAKEIREIRGKVDGLVYRAFECAKKYKSYEAAQKKTGAQSDAFSEDCQLVQANIPVFRALFHESKFSQKQWEIAWRAEQLRRRRDAQEKEKQAERKAQKEARKAKEQKKQAKKGKKKKGGGKKKSSQQQGHAAEAPALEAPEDKGIQESLEDRLCERVINQLFAESDDDQEEAVAAEDLTPEIQSEPLEQAAALEEVRGLQEDAVAAEAEEPQEGAAVVPALAEAVVPHVETSAEAFIYPDYLRTRAHRMIEVEQPVQAFSGIQAFVDELFDPIHANNIRYKDVEKYWKRIGGRLVGYKNGGSHRKFQYPKHLMSQFSGGAVKKMDHYTLWGTFTPHGGHTYGPTSIGAIRAAFWWAGARPSSSVA